MIARPTKDGGVQVEMTLAECKLMLFSIQCQPVKSSVFKVWVECVSIALPAVETWNKMIEGLKGSER